MADFQGIEIRVSGPGIIHADQYTYDEWTGNLTSISTFTFEPGSDISNAPQEVQEKAAEIWTQEVIGDYQAAVKADVPTLDEVRRGASLDKTTFCLALKSAGVLPTAEAVQAARGDWPQTFASFLQALSEEEQAIAQIEWAGATRINRVHPLLLALQAVTSITDKQLDEIFKVV